MKKLIALLSVILFISCDDGDMTFKDFNFGDATVQYCSLNDLVYKYNGSEMLILDVEPSYFSNVEKLDTIVLGPFNKVIYRNYNAQASSSAICSEIPPSSPIVIEEWSASAGGTLKIKTIKVTNQETGEVNYQHVIDIIYLEFINGEQRTVIQGQNFGTYTTPQSYNFKFIEDSQGNEINVLHCENNGLIFKYNLDEALVLNLSEDAKNALFIDEVTPEDEYRTWELTNNDRIIFDLYSGNLSVDVFCSNTPPVSPVRTERWNGEDGEIRVRTSISEVDGAYVHYITLAGITFVNSTDTEQTFEIEEYYPEGETEYPFGDYEQ